MKKVANLHRTTAHIRFGLLFGWLKHSLKALTQLDRWYAFGIFYQRSSSYMRERYMKYMFSFWGYRPSS